MAFASKQQVDSFEEIKTQEAFEHEFGIKHCPTPECVHQFVVEGEAPVLRRCEGCAHQYCVQCLLNHPETISCQNAAAMRHMTPEERATEEWKLTHTQQCPHCHKNIEKNGGCNHMTCRQENGGCGYEFCWLCLNRWDGTCEYYNCHRPRLAGSPVPVPEAAQPAEHLFDARIGH